VLFSEQQQAPRWRRPASLRRLPNCAGAGCCVTYLWPNGAVDAAAAALPALHAHPDVLEVPVHRVSVHKLL